MTTNGFEIELKAEVEPSVLSSIARQLARRTGKAGQVATLRSIYFDTVDHRLKHGGVALRIRREGRRSVQTVKADRTGVGGFQQVREVESRISGLRPMLSAIPDRSLAERIAVLAGGEPLVAQFETRVRRATYNLVERNGMISAALDSGVVIAGEAEEAISELELELTAGTPEALFDAAEVLLGGSAARLEQPNKAERGYRLLAKGRPAPIKLGSKPMPPAEDVSARGAFSAALAALAPAIATALHQTLVAAYPEGPHQLRVALRRLRTLIRLYKPLLDADFAGNIVGRARSMGQLVSPLRDADVLVPELLAASGQHDPAVGDALQVWHLALRGQVRLALLEARATGLPLELMRISALELWARAGEKQLDRPTSVAVEPSLDRLWARIQTSGDRLAGLDDERQHEFRKDLKKLRYSLEFVPKNSSMKPFVTELKRLQEALGTLNDFVVLAGFSPLLPGMELEVLQKLKEQLLETSRHRSDLALGRACRHWRSLSVVPVPWGGTVKPAKSARLHEHQAPSR